MMREMISYCGFDCAKCPAFTRADAGDVSGLPERPRCEGCRSDGIKIAFCEHLCGIRRCALKKGVTTCGDCLQKTTCTLLAPIVSTNETSRKNLNIE